MMKNKILIYVLVLGSIVTACKAPEKISLYDLSFLYRGNDFTEAEAVVFHNAEDYSTLFVRVNLAELKYEKMENLPVYLASYSISYKLLESYEARNVIDSATLMYSDSVNFAKDISKTEVITFPASYGEKYVLSVELRDLNRQSSVRSFIEVDKAGYNTAQNFLVLSENGMPIFRNYLGPDENVTIRYKDNASDRLYVRGYFRDFPIARPIFQKEADYSFDYKPDSSFMIDMIGETSEIFQLKKEGFYHFQVDTLSREGITLYRFADGFPDLESVDQLIYPIRYITKRDEYNSIMEADDRKAALDEFWLKTAGNPARARSVLQKYYNNVQDANRYFTSYHEGWKTDRGILYVIFGKPTVVYRGVNLEEWIYGEPENRNSLRFTFVQVDNPFSTNDYLLLRSPTYKDPWYITVQSWRR